MTFFKPNQNQDKFFLNIILGFLVVVFMIFSFWLIWLYNISVRLDNNIADTQSRAKDLEAQSSEIQNNIFSLFSAQNAAEAVQKDNLVTDSNPEYLKTENKSVALR